MENLLLLCASALCGVSSLMLLLPLRYKRMRKAPYLLWCLSATLAVSAAITMAVYQVTGRFEYQYVYSHTSVDTGFIYKISALWSGQEGSFLLWALILSVMGVCLLRRKGERERRVFGIYTAVCFCVFLMCFISQPFKTLTIIPTDGLGLNDALKDPWMTVHPPLVFISYSAMAVIFSLSAALSGKPDGEDLSKRILTWLRTSCFFLGAGIFTGSVWAYRALGWGGYWAWDPIENAALVPWLVLCGYLHRKDYRRRQVCLVPFSIACFGVFLARSGILKEQSAHAYTEGNFVITAIFVCFLLGTALYLIASKLKKRSLRKERQRFLKTDVRLITYSLNGYAALIFLGTVSPLIIKAETPMAYYTAISVAFALCYIVLLLLRESEQLKKRAVPAMAIRTIFGIGVIASTRTDKLWWLLLLWACFLLLSAWLASGFRQRRARYYISHLGALLLIIGAISSSALAEESYAKASIAGGSAVFSGMEIPLRALADNDIVIKSLPQADFMIRCSGITSLPEGGILIPYTIKPLIALFWAGCAVVVCQPTVMSLWERVRRRTDRPK